MMHKFCANRAPDNLQHFLSVFNVNWNTDLISENFQHIIHGLPVSSNNHCRMHLISKELLSN